MEQPFILFTDGSLSAMCTALTEVLDGSERSISFASKSSSKTQSQDSDMKRELMAIFDLTRHFKHHLLEGKFHIFTDQRALQQLHSFKDLDVIKAQLTATITRFPALPTTSVAVAPSSCTVISGNSNASGGS